MTITKDLHSLPDLDALEGLALRLARRRAEVVSDVDDLKQEALTAVWKVMERGWRGERPWAMAKTIMQRATASYYERQRRHAPIAESLDQLHKNSDRFRLVVFSHEKKGHYANGRRAHVDSALFHERADQMELLFDLEYFEALETRCGAAARLVAENLVAVRDHDCLKRIMKEIRAKQRRQRTVASHRPRGVKHEIRVSHRMVRHGLDMRPSEWRTALRSVREFTREWLSQ